MRRKKGSPWKPYRHTKRGRRLYQPRLASAEEVYPDSLAARWADDRVDELRELDAKKRRIAAARKAARARLEQRATQGKDAS